MRNKIIAVSHLIILTFYLLSPVMPYIQYTVFKEYIAKNLCVKKDIPHNCCHGKCYLEKQVKNVKETGDNEERNTNRRAEIKPLNEFLSGDMSFPDLFSSSIKYQLKIVTINVPWFVSEIFIPPEIKSLL
jgi:hypothetical protein